MPLKIKVIMTDLNSLFTEQRDNKPRQRESKDIRSEFQRDFDRIIFSSSFRRLQNKTQVFPLPGSVFVHTRLTHSLEVASVGRSLGSLIGDFIVEQYGSDLTDEAKEFYKHSLYNVISSACLCHDIGNPAFGHSGEDAIASYFIKNESELKKHFNEEEWNDFINFEGNANAIRILTQQQNGKNAGGLRLTYSTLAAIAKYPCESTGKDKKFLHRKKFGFFQSEKNTFKDIATSTAMITENESPLTYLRHPFVWLTETADDICYNIIDLEDAHRLHIIDHTTCVDLLLNLVKDIEPESFTSTKTTLDKISDKNDRIGYLRAKAISVLTMSAKEIYQQHLSNITEGKHKQAMFDAIKEKCTALQEITKFSYEYIYNHRSVVEIENAGFNVMYELLSHFIPPVLMQKSSRRKSEEKAVRLIPSQFLYETGTPYEKVMGVLDYVSGMTDNYATDLYKKIKGIEIGMTV